MRNHMAIPHYLRICGICVGVRSAYELALVQTISTTIIGLASN